jgi:hypothetical protein
MSEINKSIAVAASLVITKLTSVPASDMYSIIRNHCDSSFSQLILILNEMSSSGYDSNGNSIKLLVDLQGVILDKEYSYLICYLLSLVNEQARLEDDFLAESLAV